MLVCNEQGLFQNRYIQSFLPTGSIRSSTKVKPRCWARVNEVLLFYEFTANRFDLELKEFIDGLS